MLHPVPESSEAPRMGYVLGLQTRLIDALCALPERATVDLAWLKSVWPEVDPRWVSRFWRNDKKQRQPWLLTIAGASTPEKSQILTIMREQHDFRRLYDAPAVHRVQEVDWAASPVLRALRLLLRDFYAPYLYASHGYDLPDGNTHRGFRRTDFVAGFGTLKVCPYCDNYLQTTVIDHFLPKDSFPFLSCHPENLIPSCSDSNQDDGHKGDKPPLDWAAQEQTAAWFHPRWRSARDALRVTFEETTSKDLSVKVESVNPADKDRVENMDAMFKLKDFWGKQIEGEIRKIGGDVAAALQDVQNPTEQAVADHLKNQATQTKREIGRRGLSIVFGALYEYMANSGPILRDVIQQCKESRGTYGANPQ